MIKFPSIEQYRHVIRNVKSNAQFVGLDESGEPIYDASRGLPKLLFRGTTKIHGTNGAISYSPEYQEFTYQSRNRILTAEHDQYNFVKTMLTIEPRLVDMMVDILRQLPNMPERITVFGEWCGEGIQGGVAVSQLSKRFIYFAVRITYTEEDQRWFDLDLIKKYIGPLVTNVLDYGFSTKMVDFNYPELAQNELIEITNEVEAECPVGAAYGISGVGEGIVWTCITPGWESSKYWMKVKGEKHSVSKVKTLAAVDIEAVESIRQFIDAVVTEARLLQGLDYLREMGKPLDVKSTSDFLRWVYNDVMKEEADTAAVLDQKKIGGAISQAARPWFMRNINAAQ